MADGTLTQGEWNVPGGRLVLLENRMPAERAAGDVFVISVVKDERDILPAFLDHYRRLGARHFLFIDNESIDGTSDFLRQQPDVSLFRAEGSYQQAFCGVAWSNLVAEEFCAGGWVVIADADEFLMLPEGIDTLPEMAAEMEQELAFGLYCSVVDMFPPAPAECGEGPRQWRDLEHLLEQTSHFMPFRRAFLRQTQDFPWLDIVVEDSGIRAALSGGRYTPRLNNIPFVFWRPGFRFTHSTHAGAFIPLSRKVGAFCHFKFRPGFSRRARERLKRDDRQNVQALTAYLDRYDKLKGDHPALEGAQRMRRRADLVDGGWLSSMQRPVASESLPAAWRQLDRSRQQAFRILGSSADVWEAADEMGEREKARRLLEQVARSPSARATRALRRWLKRHGLIRPEYMPEEMPPERSPSEYLHRFLTSLWWEIAWPLRLPSTLYHALRWRRLRLLLGGREREDDESGGRRQGGSRKHS